MLVNACVYKDGEKLQKLDLEGIRDLRLPDDELLWVALASASKEEIQTVVSKIDIHELTLEDIYHGGQMAKIENYDDTLFFVIKQLAIDETSQIKSADLYMLCGKNYVVTIRDNDFKSMEPVRRKLERTKKSLQKGAGFVAYSLLDTLVDRYFPILAALEREFGVVEDQMFDKKLSLSARREILEKLHNLKSKARHMKNATGPLEDAVHKLFGGDVPDICVGLDDYYRDTHDHLARVNQSLEALLDALAQGVQTCVALINIEETQVTKQLASWAAVFAAVTLMAGVWGMNFKHMPELEWQWGYPIALLSMVGIGVFLRYRFKKSGWLD